MRIADEIITAFAIQHQTVLLHKDREFEALADEAMLKTLSYKVT